MQAYDHSNELYHHGVIGMKWGVRRYQNLDGSLTAAGKRKYGTKTNFEKVQRAKNAADPKKLKAKTKSKEKTVKDMSDDELRRRINRIKMENEFTSLTTKQMYNEQKFINTAWNKVIAPAAIEVGKNVLTNYMNKVIREKLRV